MNPSPTPLPSEQWTTNPTDSNDADAARTGTVLIVEDEEGIRLMTRLALERAGLKTLMAADGREGVEIFQQNPDEIDVILLDLTMPRLSGLEVLREVRKLRPAIKVILMSGYSADPTVSALEGVELSGKLQKPFGPTVLVSLVTSVLNS
jgi:CheY-like chemotaxis protein